jgi:hypothetical protein
MKNLIFIINFSFLFLFSSASSNNDSIQDTQPLAGSRVYRKLNQDENYQYRSAYVFNINLTIEVKLFEIHNEEISKNSSKFILIADENQVINSKSAKG